MTVSDVGTVVLAAAAVLGLMVAALGWFFKRGADEREFAVALRDNTEATRDLSKKLDGVIEVLHEHDIRITRLEVQPPPIHVTTKLEAPTDASTTAYRDPGSAGGH
jgi:hypothetical protein